MQVKTIEKPFVAWDMTFTNSNNTQESTMTNDLFSVKEKSSEIEDVNRLTKIPKDNKEKKLEFPKKILHKSFNLDEYTERLTKPLIIATGATFLIGSMLKAPLAMMALGAILAIVMVGGDYLIGNYKHNRDVKKLEETYNRLTDEQKKFLKDDIGIYPVNSSYRIKSYLKQASEFLAENAKSLNIKNNDIKQLHATNSINKTETPDISEIMWKLECEDNN